MNNTSGWECFEEEQHSRWWGGAFHSIWGGQRKLLWWDDIQQRPELFSRVDGWRKSYQIEGTTSAKELKWEPRWQRGWSTELSGRIAFLLEWCCVPWLVAKAQSRLSCRFASQNVWCVHSHDLGWFLECFQVICGHGINPVLIQGKTSIWYKYFCYISCNPWQVFFLIDRKSSSCLKPFVDNSIELEFSCFAFFSCIIVVVFFHLWQVKQASIFEVPLKHIIFKNELT